MTKDPCGKRALGWDVGHRFRDLLWSLAPGPCALIGLAFRCDALDPFAADEDEKNV